MFFDPKHTVYGGFGILEAVSSLPLGLSGGDQMMPQDIIRTGWCLKASSGSKGLSHIAFGIIWY